MSMWTLSAKASAATEAQDWESLHGEVMDMSWRRKICFSL